ncbi:hypothetical protein LNQ81_03030 [Myroides sp. M-43]|uniref:hypothetical protein n=1 Tax=Myroides oncorhynchi TaxID=2893756 RepID=UPI001E464F57|nr:hypothetical protein [Myroides oncorhynchi]MCC9041677.1 hypothetical protein [Myroides oncorhynchi]
MSDIVLMHNYRGLFILGLVLLSGLIHLFCLFSKLIVQFLTGEIVWIGLKGVIGILLYVVTVVAMTLIFIGAYCLLSYVIKEVSWQGYPDLVYYFISIMGLLISGGYGIIVVKW